MEVGEDYFIIVVFHQVVQRICLEVSNVFPALMHAVVNQFEVTKAQSGTWGWITNVVYDFFVQSSWMPHHICFNVHGSGYPHFNFRTVFSDFQHTHVTSRFNQVIAFHAVVNDVTNVFTVFHNNHWFCLFFVFVDSDVVVFAIFTFQDQSWTTNQTAG